MWMKEKTRCQDIHTLYTLTCLYTRNTPPARTGLRGLDLDLDHLLPGPDPGPYGCTLVSSRSQPSPGFIYRYYLVIKKDREAWKGFASASCLSLGEIPPCSGLSMIMGMSMSMNVVCMRMNGNRSGHVGLGLMKLKVLIPTGLVAVFRTRPEIKRVPEPHALVPTR
jgi:hypothetical protein